MTPQIVKKIFSIISPERKRQKIPPSVVASASKEVDKISRMPYKKKLHTGLFWKYNPYTENPIDIDIPVIELDKIYPMRKDFSKNAVFYTPAQVKKENIKIIKDSCIVVYQGEIMAVYITSKTDKAIIKATERVAKLAEYMDEYHKVKAKTFYTPFNLTKKSATTEEKKQARLATKKAEAVDRYSGKNWMDGMIKYYFSNKGNTGREGDTGTAISYQPRNPEADKDKDFLFDLIYTYMSLYELEKRYAPDVAKYRLELAKKAEFVGAFPGVPLSRCPATGVGASHNFSSAIHNDSGIKGLTETIIWNTPSKNNKQYFVSPTIKMCFDLTDHKAVILQPPKVPHSTVDTGEHNGIGLVNITKANLVATTAINKQYYGLYKKEMGIK
jgi:hypothetical protein